jgi:hypothetical protein
MSSSSPFLDVRSFTEEELPARVEESPVRAQASSPFLAVYELEGGPGLDPQTEAYVSFLNELYDERFNLALSKLVDEAAAIYQSNFADEQQDPTPPARRPNGSSISTSRRSWPRRRR